MAKKFKFFQRSNKKKFSLRGRSESNLPPPAVLDKEIAEAVRFIKTKQFHSGFPEIFAPEKGGEIEVSIHQDDNKSNQFHINFVFMTIPDRVTLFSKQKVISYSELKRLATEYEKHKDQIDEELKLRECSVKSQLTP